MKRFYTVVAWVGLALVTLGPIFSFGYVVKSLTTAPADWRWAWGMFLYGPLGGLGWTIAELGTLLALIGGLKVRPRHLWIALLVVGSVFAVTYSYAHIQSYELHVAIPGFSDYLPGIVGNASLGIVCIIEGIAIRIIEVIRTRRAKRTLEKR